MVSVKKQGRFEVFSRGVEEPWAVYRDDVPFKQVWTWDEVEKLLRNDAAPPPKELTLAQRRALDRLTIVGPVRRVRHEFRDAKGQRVTGLHAPTVRDLARDGFIETTNEKHTYPAHGRGKLRQPAWETTVPVYRIKQR